MSLSEIVADYQIRAMPTFVFVKQGREVARVQGANQEAIVQAIQQHHVAAASSSPLTATEEERQFLSQFVPLSEKVPPLLSPQWPSSGPLLYGHSQQNPGSEPDPHGEIDLVGGDGGR